MEVGLGDGDPIDVLGPEDMSREDEAALLAYEQESGVDLDEVLVRLIVRGEVFPRSRVAGETARGLKLDSWRISAATKLALAADQCASELAGWLTENSFADRVFFCNSGAEANEAALKLVRKARPKGDVISVHGAFHGRTFGALSATPQESKQAPFAPLVPGFVAVAPEAAAIEAAVGERTAAVLLEPIQGESGIHPLEPELLRAAREACDEHGALLIFDEVQCGMGRTGTLWAFELTPVRPDVFTTAKALAWWAPRQRSTAIVSSFCRRKTCTALATPSPPRTRGILSACR